MSASSSSDESQPSSREFDLTAGGLPSTLFLPFSGMKELGEVALASFFVSCFPIEMQPTGRKAGKVESLSRMAGNHGGTV